MYNECKRNIDSIYHLEHMKDKLRHSRREGTIVKTQWPCPHVQLLTDPTAWGLDTVAKQPGNHIKPLNKSATTQIIPQPNIFIPLHTYLQH